MFAYVLLANGEKGKKVPTKKDGVVRRQDKVQNLGILSKLLYNQRLCPFNVVVH